MFRLAALLLLAAFVLPGATADTAEPMAEDPALEKRVNEIADELRCLVCQNQTIADSHAELAVDLKNQVRDMLAEGKSRAEILDYMVARYGDFVLYRPPVKPTTYLLWIGPFLLFVIGLIVLLFNIRKRRRRSDDDAPLSEAESRRVRSLLGEETKDSRS